jgi:hypothetical protein
MKAIFDREPGQKITLHETVLYLQSAFEDDIKRFFELANKYGIEPDAKAFVEKFLGM